MFTRTSRSVTRTPAGWAFLTEACLLLLQQQQSEAAAQVARKAAQAHTGAITVGFIGATSYGFLPRLALKVRAECRHIDLTFEELEAVEQLEARALDKIDVGLMRPLMDAVAAAD